MIVEHETSCGSCGLCRRGIRQQSAVTTAIGDWGRCCSSVTLLTEHYSRGRKNDKFNVKTSSPRLSWLHSSVRPFYFVTICTYRRQAILANESIHTEFREFCRRGEEQGIAIGRYVVMPNHIHVFVAMPRDGMSLPQWAKSLKSVLGKGLLAAGVSRPHWQEGFFDHVLRSEESYSEKWKYVQMNPVRAMLCRRPTDWPYQGEATAIRF